MQSNLIAVLAAIASVAVAQQTSKPDFTGTWKVLAESGKSAETDIIEQTGSTFTITPILASGNKIAPMVYPTDGTKRAQMVGAFKVLRTGHWEGTKLLLESMRDGVSPEHGMVETISLSPDGKTITRSFHVRDGKVPDHHVTLEKVRK
ncbi:MAG TPA: hypothetical protein VGL53_23115 [Bryobacteraceae bacterium]|jgi:hypothetical protein